MTESQMIRRAREGDARAVRSLYDRYSPRVYAVVRRIAGDDQTAQDYAQETWVRVIRALPTFRGESKFSTWLHRVAVNAALQARRRESTRQDREVPIPDTVPGPSSTGDPLLAQRLEAALDRLPERMRRVLILHDVEGYTHQDIGELMGVTPGTSKSQLFKARAKMRQWLGSVHEPQYEQEQEAWSI